MGRMIWGRPRSGAAGVVCFLALAHAAAAQRSSGSPHQALTYDQAFGTAAYGVPDQAAVLADVPVIGEWVDATHYLETRREDGRRRVYVTSAADGTSRLLGAADASAVTGPGAAFRVVLRDHDLVRIDAGGGERRLTATPADEDHVRLSPDGARLAYVRDHNLFALDLASGLERQLTSDGSETILNGTPSWIYMEEILGRGSSAFWWSPDGTRLAFMRFDDEPVPVFPIYHADGQHGTLERTRYPKAGDANPYVRIGIVSIADGRTTWMDFAEKADHYLAFPQVVGRRPHAVRAVDEPGPGHAEAVRVRRRDRQGRQHPRREAADVGRMVRRPDAARRRLAAVHQRRRRLAPPLSLRQGRSPP